MGPRISLSDVSLSLVDIPAPGNVSFGARGGGSTLIKIAAENRRYDAGETRIVESFERTEATPETVGAAMTRKRPAVAAGSIGIA
jgi:hypothetical protein